MDSADRVESRAGQEERGEGSEGMQGRLEDLGIRLSGKYNGFDLAEAFDPRTDRTTLHHQTESRDRPLLIPRYSFAGFSARIESLVAIVRLFLIRFHRSLPLCSVPSRHLFLIPISRLSIFLGHVSSKFFRRTLTPESRVRWCFSLHLDVRISMLFARAKRTWRFQVISDDRFENSAGKAITEILQFLRVIIIHAIQQR